MTKGEKTGSMGLESRTDALQSSRERQLLRALADHYCGVYFVHTLEGFVHNLNSPLQILWMRSEQVQQDVGKLQKRLQSSDGGDAAELADRMKERVDSFLRGLDQLNASLNFLTKGLLGKERFGVREISINDAIEDALFLLKADMFFKHRVDVHLQLDEGLPRINGRQTDFCVIVLHLVQNALEAMIDAKEKRLAIETAIQEDDIVIRIQDTGCGISGEDGSHIFEPFFTTKDKIEYNGKIVTHMGLGLPVTSLLLDDYRGRISFNSFPEKTTFEVEIPSKSLPNS